MSEVKTLQKICYESLGISITKAPPLIQENIFKLSKAAYLKQVRKEIKEEIKEDLRTELLEEMLEDYLNVIPELVEKASSWMIEYDYKFEDSRALLEYFYKVDPEIAHLAAKCAESACEKLKEKKYCCSRNSVYDTYSYDYDYDYYDDEE